MELTTLDDDVRRLVIAVMAAQAMVKEVHRWGTIQEALDRSDTAADLWESFEEALSQCS